MPPAIHTEQLTKDFIGGFWRTERRRAVDGLTLEIGPGDVFGFLGANGAGKNATLKLLLQLIGRPPGDLSVRRRIGFLPEEPSFYDALTPEELLVYFGSRQSFGRARLDGGADRSSKQLYALLDITTTLDPQFNVAYRVGAIVLAESRPNGAGNPRAAIALLKGFRASPRRWQYLHDIGFVYYWWLRDYPSAAHWFERASAVPGAPEWLRPLAAVTLTRGGERGAARAPWQQLLDTSDPDYPQRIAAYRLTQLRVLDDLDRLNALLLRVRGETGQPAASWAPLVRRGWIPRDPPTDPAGIPYVLDRDTGVATVSERSPYHPLPDVTTPWARPPS